MFKFINYGDKLSKNYLIFCNDLVFDYVIDEIVFVNVWLEGILVYLCFKYILIFVFWFWNKDFVDVG